MRRLRRVGLRQPLKRTGDRNGVLAMLSAAHLKPIDLKQIKISSVIGSGTFNIVNKCTLHSFECAIKRLTIDKNNRSSAILESLVSEYALMSKIRHPNLLITMGVAVDPDGEADSAIVMELLQASLLDVLYEPSFAPHAKWESALLSIASDYGVRPPTRLPPSQPQALQYIARRPMGCQDCRFWLSGRERFRRGRGPHLDSDLPPYMAPEIIQWLKFTQETDVWAFGCMLSHMGTKTPPYQQLKILERHRRDTIGRGITARKAFTIRIRARRKACRIKSFR